jgi:hypothetical protein
LLSFQENILAEENLKLNVSYGRPLLNLVSDSLFPIPFHSIMSSSKIWNNEFYQHSGD